MIQVIDEDYIRAIMQRDNSPAAVLSMIEQALEARENAETQVRALTARVRELEASTSGGVIDRGRVTAAVRRYVNEQIDACADGDGKSEGDDIEGIADAVIASLPPTIDVEAVKAALEPFAVLGEWLNPDEPDDEMVEWIAHSRADYRRARDLLSQLTRPADDGEGG